MGQYNAKQFESIRWKIGRDIASQADQERKGNDQVDKRKPGTLKQKEYREQYSFVWVTRFRYREQN